MPMITHTIYFQDLNEETQRKVWNLVEMALIEEGIVREDGETDEAFLQRVGEETDHYINTHNVANEFRL